MKGRTSAARKIRVRTLSPGEDVRRSDRVAVEEPLEIRVEAGGGETRTVAVTMRTPGDDFELAAGFLQAEGILKARAEVQDISFCRDVDVQEYNVVSVRLRSDDLPDLSRLDRNFYASSACGVCGKASLESVEVLGCEPLEGEGPRLDPRILMALPDRLREAQTLFSVTGGVHAAGLFDGGGQLLAAREDVGRHNAVDKVVGAWFLGLVPELSEGPGEGSGENRSGDSGGREAAVLVVSGRASFEILQKAAMARIPFVVAVGAPSSLAVDLARRFRITLAGFTGAHGMNIYADVGRVLEGGS